MFLSIGSILIGALAFIFVLAAIVLIHEGGHFLFARRAKILCREYAFGMGPIILHKKKGETDYQWRVFPIGGFCAIAGEEKELDPLEGKSQVRLVIEDGIVTKICIDAEDPAFSNLPLYDLGEYDLYDESLSGNLYLKVRKVDGTSNTDNQEESASDFEELKVAPNAMYIFTDDRIKNSSLSFEERQKKVKEFQNAPFVRQMNSKTIWQRFLVMFGGPLMNFVLALFAFLISYFITGVSNTSSTKLLGVYEGSPAYEAGLRDGDVITGLVAYSNTDELLAYSNTNITKWADISSFMASYKADASSKEEIIVTYVTSDGASHSVTVDPIVYIYSVSMYEDIEDTENVKIAPLVKNSKAYKAGLRDGDIIKTIKIADGEKVTINSWKDVYNEFAKAKKAKTKVIIEVEREEDGSIVTKEISITPYSEGLFRDTQGVNTVEMQIGISPTVTRNPLFVVKATLSSMWGSIKKLFLTLGYLIFSSEVGIRDLSGVVGIFSLTSKAASSGFGTLLYWMGFLSVNVGFMNLLPIPALDGGRITFLIIEAIAKKPVPQKIQDKLINVTYILLLILMAFVAVNDILRFF